MRSVCFTNKHPNGTCRTVGGLEVAVSFKRMKYMHLRIHPPDGRISVSAPNQTPLRTIEQFVCDKRAWILRQRAAMQKQSSTRTGDYDEDSVHFVWGHPCRLHLIETSDAGGPECVADQLIIRTPPGSDRAYRRTLLEKWYAEQLSRALPDLIRPWEERLGIHVERWVLRPMKTRWGSCSMATRRIRLNTELARRPRACLEYILVHEMMHLLEPTHNARFHALMDRHLPSWRTCRKTLNRYPIRSA